MATSKHPHWVLLGPPAAGKTTALTARLSRLRGAGLEPERTLLLTPQRRAASLLATLLAADETARPAQWAGFQPTSVVGFAQELITRHWLLVADQYGMELDGPTFLAFDLAHFSCLQLYYEDPTAFRDELTMRPERVAAQVLSTMSLAAANSLGLEEAWERIALSRGVTLEEPLIQAALDLSIRFQAQSLANSVLPFDLQVRAANWLLRQPDVQADLRDRYDALAIDDFDEFVPSLAEPLANLARQLLEAMLAYSPDGGLRWLLGASVQRTGRIIAGLLDPENGFRLLWLRRTQARSPVALEGSATWLAEAAVRRSVFPVPSAEGWRLRFADRPDLMAAQAVSFVAALVSDGVLPGEIALITPSVHPLVSAGIGQGLADLDIPFQAERRSQTLADNPELRACLTALRAVSGGAARPITPVEAADLLATVTGTSPVSAQALGRSLFDTRARAFRPLDHLSVAPPPDAARLLDWLAQAELGQPIDERLTSFADGVLDPETPLWDACRALIEVAQRFRESAPRLGYDHDLEVAWWTFIDSGVLAGDIGLRPAPDRVLLTTPLPFLQLGRSVRYQGWLDVASPRWLPEFAGVLTNPRALSEPAGPDTPSLQLDRQAQADDLRRLLTNLSTRCEGEIWAFASRTSLDGTLLDGPLIDAFLGLGVPTR
jgi:hypothetical protein